MRHAFYVVVGHSCIIRVGIAGESSPRFSFQYDRFHKLIGERGGEVKPNSDDLNVMNTLNGIFVVLLQTKSKVTANAFPFLFCVLL